MKKTRQQKMLELISANVIATQEELQARLEAEGFSTTQSTVSRDIKALRIIKAQDSNGVYRYLTVKEGAKSHRDQSHYEEMFSRACVSVHYSMNMVIVKCYPGMASSACVALDHLFSDMILGSLAGDDTIFAVTSGEENSIILSEKLKELI